jgi:hypothetical protein
MKKITPIDELRESILLLKNKQANDWLLLKEQFHFTYESLKPINIIKNSFNDAVSGPDLKTNAVNAAIGIASGFVAKKVFTGVLHGPLTKLLGVLVEVLVASKVAKNTDGIKSIGRIILEKILVNNSEKA